MLGWLSIGVALCLLGFVFGLWRYRKNKNNESFELQSFYGTFQHFEGGKSK